MTSRIRVGGVRSEAVVGGFIEEVIPIDENAFFEGFCPNCLMPLGGSHNNWCPSCHVFWNAIKVER